MMATTRTLSKSGIVIKFTLLYFAFVLPFCSFSQLPYYESFSVLKKNVESTDSLLSARGFSYLGSKKDKSSTTYQWAYEPNEQHKSIYFISSVYFNNGLKVVTIQMALKNQFDAFREGVKSIGFRLLKTYTDSLGVHFDFTDKVYDVQFTMEGLRKGKATGTYFVTLAHSYIKKAENRIKKRGNINIVFMNEVLILGEEGINKYGWQVNWDKNIIHSGSDTMDIVHENRVINQISYVCSKYSRIHIIDASDLEYNTVSEVKDKLGKIERLKMKNLDGNELMINLIDSETSFVTMTKPKLQ